MENYPNLFRCENFQLIPPKQATRITNIPLRRLYRITNQELPHFKIGNQIRYQLKDILNVEKK